MRLCVDLLSTSWRKEREEKRTDGRCGDAPLPFPSPPTSHLSPSRLCLVPGCLLPCASCLVPAHPRCLPTDQHERPTGWAVRWVSTLLLSLSSMSHFEFCNAGIAKHDSAPHETADLGRAEQEIAVTEQSRASFDRIRPSPERGGDFAVVFFWGSVPTGSWRLQSRKCCGFGEDSEVQMDSRNRTDRGTQTAPMVSSVALVMSCRVPSFPNPWVVDLGSCHSCILVPAWRFWRLPPHSSALRCCQHSEH